ncbi:ABC transporter ATP-binding protein [Bauldia sp.]|uniref:ABC transporter ATP-binding protein n=1 Tax=Bauldia sp. TaxID=2575872 RepID=UPI003BAA28F2
MTTDYPYLAVNGLEVRLGGTVILSGVDLKVSPGSFVAIVGPNGAGKTTLLRSIAGLVDGEGAVELDGTPLRQLAPKERAIRLGYLPQGHVFHWPISVKEIVGLGRLPRGSGADLSREDEAAVDRALDETGVASLADRTVTTLSGGERARVALARVLATETPLVLADEPTTSLDPRYQLVVLDILKRHAEAAGAVVAVLHDLGLAARYADQMVILDQGRVAAAGPPRTILTTARLAETFGVAAEILDRDGTTVIIPRSVL